MNGATRAINSAHGIHPIGNILNELNVLMEVRAKGEGAQVLDLTNEVLSTNLNSMQQPPVASGKGLKATTYRRRCNEEERRLRIVLNTRRRVLTRLPRYRPASSKLRRRSKNCGGVGLPFRSTETAYRCRNNIGDRRSDHGLYGNYGGIWRTFMATFTNKDWSDG